MRMMGTDCLAGPVAIRQGVMVLIGKRAELDWKIFFMMKVLRSWKVPVVCGFE